MKKKKTWRLIGFGYNLDDTIACDVVCEETKKVKTVNIVNNEKSIKVLYRILKNDNLFLIPRSIFSLIVLFIEVLL